jgi:hypothetical protein
MKHHIPLLALLAATLLSCVPQSKPSEQAASFFRIADKVTTGPNYGFDPHDLFHWWAAANIPQEQRNPAMICGCAYVYGGSWGISWPQIQETFRQKMLDGQPRDWLTLYVERYNFGDSEEKHLLVTQYVNAKIIEPLLRAQDYDAVLTLLSSGNMREHRREFFDTLQQVTGINEQNFNEKVNELLNT